MQAPSLSLRQRQGRWLILLLVQIGLLAWLFRGNWSNGFSAVFGDRYDSLIETAVLEHWYNVVRGLAHWSSVHYFYPYANTLGYNDGYLAYGLIYSIGRFAGADPLLAAMLVNMAMKVIACLGFHIFARRVLRLEFAYALLGAVVFTVSNNVVLHILHAQLLTIAFVPLAATLLHGAVCAALDNDSERLRRYGIGFALLYALWAMTAFYLLWFFSLFVLVLTGCQLLLLRNSQSPLRAIRRSTWRQVGLVLALQLLLLLPFLLTYLPKAAETGMHQYATMLAYALRPFDLLNIGVDNYLYGEAVRWLHARIGFPMMFSESQMGLPPLLLLVFLAGLAWLARRDASARGRLVLAAGLAALLVSCLALRLGDVSAWHFVYKYVPGAKGVRVISRWMVFLVFPVTAVAMYFLATLQRTMRRPLAAGMLAVCSLLLVGEELNRNNPVYIDRGEVVRMLTAVPPPPAACRAFFVQDARPGRPGEGDTETQLYRHNVEAMLIAEYVNLPTVNGFSTFNPPDWRFDYPARPDYAARVAAYRARHDLQGLCSLDMGAMRWAPPAADDVGISAVFPPQADQAPRQRVK